MPDSVRTPGDPQPFEYGPAHVTEVLADMQFPADREALLRHARTRSADEDVLTFLGRLPDLHYQNLDQVLGMANTIQEAA